MKRVRKTSFTFLIIIFLFACSKEKTIEKETLAKVYVDLLLAEDIYVGTDSLELKKNEIFVKYGINKDLYDSTFIRFEHDTEKWDDFFNIANSYLDTLKANEKKTENKLVKP